MAKGIYSYPDLRMEGFNSASWGKWDKPKTREIRLGGGWADVWAEDPGLNNTD